MQRFLYSRNTHLPSIHSQYCLKQPEQSISSFITWDFGQMTEKTSVNLHFTQCALLKVTLNNSCLCSPVTLYQSGVFLSCFNHLMLRQCETHRWSQLLCSCLGPTVESMKTKRTVMLVITNYWINPLNSFHFPQPAQIVFSIHSLVCGYLDIYFHASVLVMEGRCVYCLNEWTAHNTSLFKIKDPEHEIRPFFSLIQIRNIQPHSGRSDSIHFY